MNMKLSAVFMKNSGQEVVEEMERHLFGLLPAFFGRSHTGWAALLTGTSHYCLFAVLQQHFFQFEECRTQAYPSGKVVIYENIWFEIDI